MLIIYALMIPIILNDDVIYNIKYIISKIKAINILEF